MIITGLTITLWHPIRGFVISRTIFILRGAENLEKAPVKCYLCIVGRRKRRTTEANILRNL